MTPTYPKLKVVYFPFSGRVEATRLALFIGGIPFVDEYVDEFVEGFAGTPQAAAYPYRQLPVLEVDGKPIAESMAMLRYAGRLAGLYPVNDPVGCLLIDEVLELVEVFTEKCLRWERTPDTAEQQVLERELLQVTIPSHFAAINAKVEAMATHPTFAHTSQIFIHDLALRCFLECDIIRSDWEKFIKDPTTTTHWHAAVNKVKNHPKVQHYYALEALREAAIKTPYKLTDIDSIHARSEPIRNAFRIGGLSFEDDRLAANTAADAAAKLPFPHQVPVLTTPDGRVVSRTDAILRFIGSLTGLYPAGQDPLVALRVDELLCHLEELQNQWYYPLYTATDDGKRRKHRELVATKTIPTFLADLDRRVGEWAGPYATGDSLTIADLALAGVLDQVASGTFLADGTTDKPASVPVDSYSNLRKIEALVKQHPALQQ